MKEKGEFDFYEFPMYVGINRARGLLQDRASRVPHVRGD